MDYFVLELLKQLIIVIFIDAKSPWLFINMYFGKNRTELSIESPLCPAPIHLHRYDL